MSIGNVIDVERMLAARELTANTQGLSADQCPNPVRQAPPC